MKKNCAKNLDRVISVFSLCVKKQNQKEKISLPFQNGLKPSLAKSNTTFQFLSPLFSQQINNIKIKMKNWYPPAQIALKNTLIRKETAG